MSSLFKHYILTLPLILFALVLVGCSESKEDHKHSFETKWEHNETYHWHNCNSCDEKENLSKHNFSDWKLIDETKGLKRRDCSVCGYK